MSSSQEPEKPLAPPNQPNTTIPAKQLPEVALGVTPKIDPIGMLLQIHAKLTAEFLGPFPSPDTLARLEEIVPGSAARIINMAETQMLHRQHLEKTVIEGDVSKSWSGLWAGLTIGILGIVGTVILGFASQPILGGVLAGGTLVSLVSVFVVGTTRRKAEREEKAKVMAAANESHVAQNTVSRQNPQST